MGQLAGEWILAEDVVLPQVVKKTATQSVTSSTTYVDDDDLQVTLGIGTYRVELFAHVSGAGGGDFKCRWAFSGTLGSTARTEFGPGINTTSATAVSAAATTVGTVRAVGEAYTTDGRYGTDGANFSGIREDLYFEVQVAGLLKFQWAQDTSNGTATQVSPASRLYITLLDPV
jgi:hypothetical protein